MSFFRRFAFATAQLRSSFLRRKNGEFDEPVLDTAEELQKIQRGVRRLSLAADRNGEILGAAATRLDEIRQLLFSWNPPQSTGIPLDEAELLRVLDQLERALGAPELPPAARAWIDDARGRLVRGARWEVVAALGAKPEGADIRIAEFLGSAGGNGYAEARIYRILEQGYRRADGSLLRPGVVIAAEAHARDASAEKENSS